MKHIFLDRFVEQLHQLPLLIQNRFNKQLVYLLSDLRHPSLHAKKYDESRGIWQARVNKSFRFYFLIDNDVYVLLEIKRHPK